MYRIWRVYTDGRFAEPTTVTRKTLRAARSWAGTFNAEAIACCDPHRFEAREEVQG